MDVLVLNEDGTYVQTFTRLSDGYSFRNEGNSWRIETAASGGLYLHLANMRRCDNTDEPCENARGGGTTAPAFFPFEFEEFATSLIGDIRNSIEKASLPISFVSGSFWYQTKDIPGGVGFRIDNDTSLQSGTHIAGRYRYEGFGGSVEDVIDKDPLSGLLPISSVIARNQIISILSPRTREETGFPLGGGNMTQTFVWAEEISACQAYAWIAPELSDGDIEPWPDYWRYTSDPLLDFPR